MCHVRVARASLLVCVVLWYNAPRCILSVATTVTVLVATGLCPIATVRVQLQPGQSELQPNLSELQPVCVQLQLDPSSCSWSILPVAIDVVSQLQLQGISAFCTKNAPCCNVH